MIKGSNLILYINDEPIACARNGRISMDSEFINVCSPVSGSFDEVLPSKLKWAAVSDCLISDPQYADYLMEMMVSKQPCSLWFSLDGAGNRKGSCFISNIEQTGTVKNLAKFNIKLQGTGPIDKCGIRYPFANYLNGLSIIAGAGIREDADDAIDFVEVQSKYPFKLKFFDTPYWFVCKGKHDAWKQDIDSLDASGNIRNLNVANGIGGESPILPPGYYVVYASNYQYVIDMQVFK